MSFIRAGLIFDDSETCHLEKKFPHRCERFGGGFCGRFGDVLFEAVFQYDSEFRNRDRGQLPNRGGRSVGYRFTLSIYCNVGEATYKTFKQKANASDEMTNAANENKA